MDKFLFNFSSNPTRSNPLGDIAGFNCNSDNSYGLNNNAISGVKYEPVHLPNIDHRLLRRSLMNPAPGDMDTQNVNQDLTANSIFVPTPGVANVGNQIRFNHGLISQVKQEPGWIAPPPGFTHSLGSNHRNGIVPSAPARVHLEKTINYLPVPNRPELAQVAVTETVRRQYVATIPSNHMLTAQNDIGRVRRALALTEPQFNTPIRSIQTTNVLFDNITVTSDGMNRQTNKILDPKPLDVFPPLDPDQNRKRRRAHFFEEINNVDHPYDDDNDHDEEGGHNSNRVVKEEVDGREYDGRTHSLPCRKFGPYTCPRCGVVSDTSQKFASHMLGQHYRFESEEQKKKRLRARNKRRLEVLNGISRRAASMMERVKIATGNTGTATVLERVGTATGHNGPIKNEGGDEEENLETKPKDGALVEVVVKQEPVV